MLLHDFLRSRRSVRRFKPDPLEDAAVERMLATAVCAPSAHNRQPWRFCVLRAPSSKARLADAMAADFRRDLLRDKLPEVDVETRVEASRARINSSPLVIVLCMDMSEMDVYPDARRAQAERMMAIQSTAAAGLQLLLAAHAEGLAGVWTCGPLFAPDVVRAALELDPGWEPQAMFFIGQPAQAPRPKEMKPLESVVRWL
jgi:coenzyme F420-0:L-glutamate ligase / coenzyme F420-1:gamma-L-glutamate ligase